MHTTTGFRHEALLYAGMDGFLDATLPFIEEAVAAGEPTLVVVNEEKIELLRSHLGRDSGAVCFLDMAWVGRNPACIIPAWGDFLAEHATSGRHMRGIGEPVWAGRDEAELAECQRHESLLNVAFGEGPAWWLLCPYDVDTLPADVVRAAERSHPFVVEGEQRRASAAHAATKADDPFAGTLPEPVVPVAERPFARGPLNALRRFVVDQAVAAGLDRVRTDDLVLAVTEAASNSLRHGGGQGTLRVWWDDRALVCEIRDHGRITHPLAGRERPSDERVGGRGLWLVNHLCDLVQVRSSALGTILRLHMRL
ncbi:MAG TPA: sensor histidine kinase [Acidimicrobiales bacterium]|nr:sensor histidine kinase [Acidimicrobiales bacterium]